jgi:hypothetical protein
MEARYPIYATADITVESRDLPHETVVGEIIDALTKHPLLTSHVAHSEPLDEAP